MAVQSTQQSLTFNGGTSSLFRTNTGSTFGVVYITPRIVLWNGTFASNVEFNKFTAQSISIQSGALPTGITAAVDTFDDYNLALKLTGTPTVTGNYSVVVRWSYTPTAGESPAAGVSTYTEGTLSFEIVDPTPIVSSSPYYSVEVYISTDYNEYLEYDPEPLVLNRAYDGGWQYGNVGTVTHNFSVPNIPAGGGAYYPSIHSYSNMSHEIVSGSLPPGISYVVPSTSTAGYGGVPRGLLRGTPTQVGDFTCTFRFTSVGTQNLVNTTYTTMATINLSVGDPNNVQNFGTILPVQDGGTAALGDLSGVSQGDTVNPLIPGIPTGITATKGDTEVALSWTAVSGATSYKIYYSTSTNVTTSSLSILGITTNSHTHTGLSNGTPYYYRIVASNVTGDSAISALVSATPNPPAPSAPANPAAVAGSSQVSLSWGTVGGATSYKIYFSTSSGVTTSSSAPIVASTNSYAHTGRTNGTPYYYKIAAVGPGGDSLLSSEVSATPVAPAPTVAPSGLSSTVANGTIVLSWNSVAGATGYKVYYGTSLPLTSFYTTANTSYTFTGLPNGTVHYFEVSATNSGGEGPKSASYSATPARKVTISSPGDNSSWNTSFNLLAVVS